MPEWVPVDRLFEAVERADWETIDRGEIHAYNYVYGGSEHDASAEIPARRPEKEHNAGNYRRRNGCRCETCRTDHRLLWRVEMALRQRRITADPGLAPHGEVSTYEYWGCRCDPCRAAAAAARKRKVA